MSITITEALAELKLIKSKVEKKKNFILANVARQEGAKDQLEKSGGTTAVLAQELQAVGDLQERLVKIRTAIATANSSTSVEIGGVKRTIAEWLIWRRDVAPLIKNFEKDLAMGIGRVKAEAQRSGYQIVKNGEAASKPTDVIVEVDEMKLQQNAENTQEILDTLDGKLSLHNATVQVEV